ncbi:uncharacterized protein H6S33_004153 [Morchella sextelata]|uniref:uncharacterized protein n=1 Tax=Morchella sextelata TaxID=1174677 RepID=UPI001D041D9A|nr:uncharacterized protein H6S33_004153 [Morchella sextelata]KAH0605696.1 hypothetical protein H6S33_004153 [Morchella sextelata]
MFTTTTTTVTAAPPTEQPAEGAVAATSVEEDEEETTDNAEEISEWDKRDNLAVVFLQSNIEFEVILTLTPADTAHHLWTQLEDRFDRKTVSSLHSLLANVVTLQYTPDKGIKEHLIQFNTLWSSLLTRTSNSTDKTKDPLSYHLHQLASVSEGKASFLLLSLRYESLESVVDNLQTKPELTSDDVYEKLLDLDSRRNNDEQAAGEAYNVRRGNPGHGSNNNVGKARNNKKDKKDLTCTWCTKNGEYAKGHTHKDCQKLKAFRDKEKSAASGNLNVASGTAFQTKLDLSCIPDLSGLPTLEEADVFTMPVSFDFTTFSDTSDVKMEDYFGFIAGPSISDNKAWIFDPGATNHMTGTQVTNPSPYSGTVTVGDGRKLQITGIRNITINGSHGPITLQNVFLIPELGNINLMS